MKRIVATDDSTARVDVRLDGVPVAALSGESVAAMMIARGMRTFRRTRTGQPRAPYCAMGTCFECRVEVARPGEAAITMRACMTPVEHGMIITTGDAESGAGKGR